MMRIFFHFHQKPLQVAGPLQRLVALPLAASPHPVNVPLFFSLHPGGFGKIMMPDNRRVPLRADFKKVNRLALLPPTEAQLRAGRATPAAKRRPRNLCVLCGSGTKRRPAQIGKGISGADTVNQERWRSRFCHTRQRLEATRPLCFLSAFAGLCRQQHAEG